MGAWSLQNCNRPPSRSRSACSKLSTPPPPIALWAHFPFTIFAIGSCSHLTNVSVRFTLRGAPQLPSPVPMPARGCPQCQGPRPPAQRATYYSLHKYTERHRKAKAVASEALTRGGRTSPRLRCLARRPSATACHAAPNTFRIWGFQEGGKKNGDGKAPDWPHSRRNK